MYCCVFVRVMGIIMYFILKLSINLMLPNWLWLCYVDFYFGYFTCILLAMIACDCYIYLLFKLRTWLFMGGFYQVAHCNDSDQLWWNDVYVFSDVALVIISSNKILNYISLSSFCRGPLVVTNDTCTCNAFRLRMLRAFNGMYIKWKDCQQ